MNILILEGRASLDAGGAERTMRQFLETVASDHQVHLVYMEPGEYVTDPTRAALYASTTRMQLRPLALANSYAWVSDLIALVRLVRRERIDRIVTHMVHISPLLRGLRALTGVPFSFYFKWVLSTPTAGAKVTWGNREVDRAAAVSGFVRDYWIRNGVPHGRICIVPEGVDVPEFAWSPNSATFTIGFAGRLVPEKGLIDLLTAMPLILARCPDATLRIAGTYRSDMAGAAYKAQVEHCIHDLDIAERVIFDGFVSPLDEWLAERDVVVVPSTCDDAQPIVMMQAMAVGVPIVATRVGGIPEVLSGKFESLLVQTGSPEALSEKILGLMLDSETGRRIGSALRRHCVNHYTRPAHMVSLTAALGLSPDTQPIIAAKP